MCGSYCLFNTFITRLPCDVERGVAPSPSYNANPEYVELDEFACHDQCYSGIYPSKLDSDRPSSTVLHSEVSTVQRFQCIEVYGDAYVWE